MTCATNYFCSSPIISVFLNLYSSYPGPKQLKNTVCVILGYACLVAQSYPTLCDPMDGSPPGSSVPEILQARILTWVVISFSNACMHAKSLQSCPTLCDLMDSSPPGSSVPGILQARILEWVAMSFSNAYMHAKSLQSCLTVCDPMDSSPPGSSVHRIL